LREEEGEKKQKVRRRERERERAGDTPAVLDAVKDEENERHNAWTARY